MESVVSNGSGTDMSWDGSFLCYSTLQRNISIRFCGCFNSSEPLVRVLQWFPPERFGTWWSVLSTSMNVSGAAGPIVSAFLLTFHSWRVALNIAGKLTIVLHVTSSLLALCSNTNSWCFALNVAGKLTALLHVTSSLLALYSNTNSWCFAINIAGKLTALLMNEWMKNYRRSSHGHHGSKCCKLVQHTHSHGSHAFTHTLTSTQLQLHCAKHQLSYYFSVHTVSFRVSVIYTKHDLDYRIFIMRTWSFFCMRVHMGVRHTDSESAQHFSLGKNSQIFCVVLMGFKPWVFGSQVQCSTNWATLSPQKILLWFFM